MKRLVAAFAAVLILAVADFAAYVADNGMECRASGCSTLVDVTRALLVALVLLAALLLVAIIGKAIAGTRSSSSST